MTRQIEAAATRDRSTSEIADYLQEAGVPYWGSDGTEFDWVDEQLLSGDEKRRLEYAYVIVALVDRPKRWWELRLVEESELVQMGFDEEMQVVDVWCTVSVTSW